MKSRRFADVLAAIAIPIGILLGLGAGGTMRNLSRVRLRFEWLIIGAFVIQGAARGRLAGTAPMSLGLLTWATVSLVLVVLLLQQQQTPGLLLIAAGTTLNVLVVLLNQGMPVVLPIDEAWPRIANLSAGFYNLAHQGTYLIWLGDVLPLRIGPYTFMASAGDILLSVGATAFIVAAMTTLAGQE